jgi:Uma2 family endonuclease
MNALTLTLRPILELTDEQFYQLCQHNQDLRLERSAQGELIIMPPTGGRTGNRSIKLAAQLENWSSQTNLGVAFDSSTCFKLPNGADRSPDAAWVQRQRWDALTETQQEQFPPLCPNFVVELRSKTDALKPLQNKMQEYMDNGAQLGWLIDPQTKQVEVYRSHQAKEVLQNPETLSGETVLPGFVLNLAALFSA